ncbi:MAG: hypothetical protein K2P68_12065 [Sphingomonas sp.]|nr:hypothetical protein [Sphingomonas sp.]
MGQPKPFASLSSGLLARKGQARPAMRPQGFAGFGTIAEAIDDLGWNDMGVSEQSEPAQVLPIVPTMRADADQIDRPPVLRAREVLQDEFTPMGDDMDYDDPVEAELDDPAPVLEQIQQAKRRKANDADMRVSLAAAIKAPSKAKAAFTLRLDGDRHLRLRLASALRHQSAQMLVTAALDAFLRAIPELDEMAARLGSHGTDIAEIEG